MNRSKIFAILDKDTIMLSNKEKLEACKKAMIEIMVDSVSRMKELVDIEEGKVGDIHKELPMYVGGLAEAIQEDIASGTMDVLLPGWDDEPSIDQMIDQLKGMLAEMNEDSNESPSIH